MAFTTSTLFAQRETQSQETELLAAPQADVLKEETWEKLDASVDKALKWLITQQNQDGSFKTIQRGQPGITAFCVMAFLAQGQSPVDGEYQKQITKAIEFIVDHQKPNGLIAVDAPAASPIPRVPVTHTGSGDGAIGRAAVYNHAISALALSEAYGQCSGELPKSSRRLPR